MDEEFRGGGGDRSVEGGHGGRSCYGDAEGKKLELRLGLPGGEDWSAAPEKREHHGHISKVPKSTNVNASSGAKRGFLGAVEPKVEGALTDKMTFQQQQQLGFIQLQAKGKKELLQRTSGRAEQQSLEGKAYGSHASSSKNAAAAHSSSQPRASTTPVVGWPPIQSFRKNLTGTAKPCAESPCESSEKKLENDKKGLFVKINMDGFPIGRKVNLKAYGSYEKLSLSVNELFRGLVSAPADQIAASAQENAKEKQVITSLLDGHGEYTLVYEDDEGDRMLVGDIPWDMFVSTAKRLLVLKSSDLSASSLGAINRKRTNGS